MLNITANSTSKTMVVGEGCKLMLVFLMSRMFCTTQDLNHGICARQECG